MLGTPFVVPGIHKASLDECSSVGGRARRPTGSSPPRPTRQRERRRAARSQSLAKQPRLLDGGWWLLLGGSESPPQSNRHRHADERIRRKHTSATPGGCRVCRPDDGHLLAVGGRASGAGGVNRRSDRQRSSALTLPSVAIGYPPCSTECGAVQGKGLRRPDVARAGSCRGAGRRRALPRSDGRRAGRGGVIGAG